MDNAKPAVVLIFFILLIALFAGGVIGQTDLTPDTPAAITNPDPNSSFNANLADNNPSFMNLQGQGAAAGVSGKSSVFCGSTYTVQSGDTFWQIARKCGLSMADLAYANPGIANINLIHPGQQINIVYRNVPADFSQPTETPVISQPNPAEQPTATEPLPVVSVAPAATQALESFTLPPTGLSPQEQTLAAIPTAPMNQPTEALPSSGPESQLGPKPGGAVTIRVSNFPPQTVVSVGIGLENTEPEFVRDEQSDANGQVTTTVFVPPWAKAGERWVITVWTKDNQTRVNAPSFVVGQ